MGAPFTIPAGPNLLIDGSIPHAYTGGLTKAQPTRSSIAPLDLETRVSTRKSELIAELIEYKKGSRLDAAESIERIRDQLADLARIVKDTGNGVFDDRARTRLATWMAR
ncbi:MAG TPA: hypothetical protein VIV58_21590 [Kofleriaceae bacterium]